MRLSNGDDAAPAPAPPAPAADDDDDDDGIFDDGDTIGIVADV